MNSKSKPGSTTVNYQIAKPVSTQAPKPTSPRKIDIQGGGVGDIRITHVGSCSEELKWNDKELELRTYEGAKLSSPHQVKDKPGTILHYKNLTGRQQTITSTGLDEGCSNYTIELVPN